MTGSEKDQIKIEFQGESIKRVSSLKYLGVHLEEKLNLAKRKSAYLIGFNKMKIVGIHDQTPSTESMLGVKKRKRGSKLLIACNIDTIKARLSTMRMKMCLRTLKNDLTRELMNEMYNNDFSARRDEKCVIGHLKKVTQGFDENMEELVQEGILAETINRNNINKNIQKEAIREVSDILLKKGKERSKELNRVLDLMYQEQ
ncbi:unnamed protein product [Brachionus calyciflorus]|uniref:Uncharacterized protein n=1 Tax=Brachionus calyciflorus TaxID=104777 RepID=A0A813U687_9BILA|nr:unnamed protein product [Brachionus calyciflorus]